MTTFSAPGKLVLAGEYAVTDGHMALVAAVSLRATCRVTPAIAPGVLRVRGNAPRLIDVHGDRASLDAHLPLLAAVVDAARAAGHAVGEGDCAVDSAAFSVEGGKLGLGSSAAVATAFAAALLRRDGVDVDRDAVHAVARAAHRAFQGGGSGIDIAAASYGGVLTFQNGRAAPAPPLPSALAALVVYSGTSVSTQGFVDAYRALPDRAHHAERLAAAATAFAAACEHNDADAVLVAVDAARTAMSALGDATQKAVVTPPHARIAALALEHGGAAKPSGAGGGDIAVVLVPAEAKDELAQALRAEQFTLVDVELGAAGVRVDPA